VADSIQCARELMKAGYTHAFCTPHVWPDLPRNNIAEIVSAVAVLQKKYDEAGLEFTLLPGGELNLVWIWPVLEKGYAADIVTYGMKGKYVLFDFWAEKMAECNDCLDSALRFLVEQEFVPILAHPERVAALQADPHAVERYYRMGVKLQMNTWCITYPKESPIFRMAERLLKEGKYFLLGTDLHNFKSMPDRIKGMEIAEKMVGREAFDALTMLNPRQLLSETHAEARDRVT
jgi:protein-tyrosine phosphatase